MAKATLTTKQLCAGFGVSHMTISHWRKGTATRAALPTVADATQPRAVLFPAAGIKAWAKTHKLPFALPADGADVAKEPAKPGPKAKIEAQYKAAVKTGRVKPTVEKAGTKTGRIKSANAPVDSNPPKSGVTLLVVAGRKPGAKERMRASLAAVGSVAA